MPTVLHSVLHLVSDLGLVMDLGSEKVTEKEMGSVKVSDSGLVLV